MNNNTTESKYEFVFSINMGKALPSVGKIVDSVNETMHEFGFSEKMLVVSSFPVILTSSRELTEEEQTKAGQIMLEGYKEKLPTYEIELVSITHV